MLQLVAIETSDISPWPSISPYDHRAVARSNLTSRLPRARYQQQRQHHALREIPAQLTNQNSTMQSNSQQPNKRPSSPVPGPQTKQPMKKVCCQSPQRIHCGNQKFVGQATRLSSESILRCAMQCFHPGHPRLHDRVCPPNLVSAAAVKKEEKFGRVGGGRGFKYLRTALVGSARTKCGRQDIRQQWMPCDSEVAVHAGRHVIGWRHGGDPGQGGRLAHVIVKTSEDWRGFTCDQQ